MNVVTANLNKEIIDKLDMDIIKRVDGEHDLRELLGNFVNLYFNKMIIDITSIKGYENLDVMNQLAHAVDPSRVILLLPDDGGNTNDKYYLSSLIKMGFYNFTRNFEGIKFLYKTPNTYDNVKHLIIEGNAASTGYVETKEVVHKMNGGDGDNRRVIIGLQNLSVHAGASSLTVMMTRQLRNAGINAVGIEMFKQDLIFYHEDFLFACMNKNDLESKLRDLVDAEVVILDMNEFGEAEKFCDDILYLIEPSYIRLTKMIKKNRNVLVEHKGDKIVLNMSFVNDHEIPDFEYETKVKVFANIPPVNDRDKNIKEINDLLYKLDFNVNTNN